MESMMSTSMNQGPEYLPIEPLPVATADEVRQIRTMMGLTQGEAADRVGVSNFTWWRWEKDKRPITEHYTQVIRSMYEEWLESRAGSPE